jgi:hypothetical protein
MTAITQYDTAEITAQAREVRFSVVALTIVLGVLWLPGWLAGKAWLLAIMAFFALRRGYRDGTGWTPPPPRQQAPDGLNKR